MHPDPHRLLVLRAVRRTGSVQAAAAALHLTSSGVSQHLARLESETGLRLLDRTRRGGGRAARLTSAGVALAERAETVAAALAEAGHEADRLRDGSHGTVRIGGFATALGRLVVPTIQQLAISDPALQPQVFEVPSTDEGLGRLQAGELDLLVSDRRLEAADHPALVQDDLHVDHYRIVVPEVWPTAQTLELLLSGPWITAPPGEPPRRMFDRLCSRYARTPSTQHVCGESRTMLALVAAGLGAAVVPDLTLSFLPTPGISVHPTTAEVGSRTVTVLGPERAHALPATNRFRELLVRTAGSQRRPGLPEAGESSGPLL